MPNKRLKNWNYTEKHDRLAKNLGEGKTYITKKQAMEDAGYKDQDSSENISGVQKMLKDKRLPERAVIRIGEQLELSDDADRNLVEVHKARTEAGVIILKLAGEYVDRSKVEADVKVNKTAEALDLIIQQLKNDKPDSKSN